MMNWLTEFMLSDFMHKPVWMWLIFFAIIIVLLSLDLGLLHRKQHAIGIKESLVFSGFYISMGLLFGLWVWWLLGEQKAIEYITGFVVEKSLSMDNIFVIALIFSYFAIPRIYQHRVLFYGILGVLFLRGVMIGAGATLVSEFGWILYIFAAFLIYSGFKMLFSKEEEHDISENPILLFMKKKFRTTDKLYGDHFFMKLPSPRTGKKALYATPLLICLMMIEIADVIFAVDSVPAIFSITLDPYIVYTSNVFAILGLRALFFALSAMIERFAYLKYALSAVLIFIGSKVFIAKIFDLEEFPPTVSLAITVLILASGFGYSIWKTRGTPENNEKQN